MLRVIEVGDGAGFGQIGFGVFGPSHQLAMRHLDRHEPLQLVVMGEIDEAEAALAQDLLDPVATDALGRREVARAGGPSSVRTRPRFEAGRSWAIPVKSGASSSRRIIAEGGRVRYRPAPAPGRPARNSLRAAVTKTSRVRMNSGAATDTRRTSGS